MLPGWEMMGCTELAVPGEVMQHVVRVESSFNPYAIGVVGGRLARQPRDLPEAIATVRMLEKDGYNFSLGLAQVNRHNLAGQGLTSYEQAFDVCPNLRAGARILAECYRRAGEDWGKALSCYYSGNFVTGFDHGYVSKVMASWRQPSQGGEGLAIPLAGHRTGKIVNRTDQAAERTKTLVQRRVEEAVAGVVRRAATANMPEVEDLRREASSLNDDAPVTVRAMRDVPASPQQQSPTFGPDPSQSGAGNGDEAFVF